MECETATVRETSIKAYNTIKDNGLLSNLRWLVYSWLYNNGPSIGRKVYEALGAGSENSGTYQTRISELVRMDVVKECGVVKSEFSGHDVLLFDVTSNLPRKLETIKRRTFWVVKSGTYIAAYEERKEAEQDMFALMGAEVIKVKESISLR